MTYLANVVLFCLQVVDHVLGVVSHPAARYCRSNVICRMVDLIDYNVRHLTERCFICGTLLRAAAGYPTTCSNNLCR